MTLEELVKIIAEIAAKYLILDRQRVLALGHDEANRAELMEAAQSINGRADYVARRDLEWVSGVYDAVFVDYIPFPDAAEAALGLAFSPWGRLMAGTLSRGKPVFQLKRSPGSGELSPAYREMMKGCWKQLYALGVRLLEGGRLDNRAGKSEAVYVKNVLSRQDLAAYAKAGRIVLGKGVVVTALAADAAKAMHIEIVRPE